MLPRLVTYNTNIQSFQYKILNNVLFLNKKPHTSRMKLSLPCSFCNLSDEKPSRVFYECGCVNCFWADLVQSFQNSITLPILTLQTATFERDS